MTQQVDCPRSPHSGVPGTHRVRLLSQVQGSGCWNRRVIHAQAVYSREVDSPQEAVTGTPGEESWLSIYNDVPLMSLGFCACLSSSEPCTSSCDDIVGLRLSQHYSKGIPKWSRAGAYT